MECSQKMKTTTTTTTRRIIFFKTTAFFIYFVFRKLHSDTEWLLVGACERTPAGSKRVLQRSPDKWNSNLNLALLLGVCLSRIRSKKKKTLVVLRRSLQIPRLASPVTILPAQRPSRTGRVVLSSFMTFKHLQNNTSPYLWFNDREWRLEEHRLRC